MNKILQWAREEYVDDLPHAYREQNDIDAMTDDEICAAWMMYGTNSGTEDWDDAVVSD